jgi:hypothetical protein
MFVQRVIVIRRYVRISGPKIRTGQNSQRRPATTRSRGS